MRRPIPEDDEAKAYAVLLRKPEIQPCPTGWHMQEHVFEAHRILAREFIARMPEPVPTEGRGIVICGGGPKYFTCAYVNIRMLRSLGSTLPIELWHYDEEVDDRMRASLANHDVRFVNADQIALPWMHRELKRGYEIKPFAICCSRFREILFLDADNTATKDPEFLFDSPEYRETGAIFWPDYGRLASTRDVWRACEVQYRDEPEHETGQIVVDKARVWKPLALAMHYNDHSEFYYHFQLGDKDLFHMAFHRLGKPYSMPPYPIKSLASTMCQHDFDGNVIFQHRNFDKWKYDGSNHKIFGFKGEELAHEFLGDLRKAWNGVVGFEDKADHDPKRLLVGRLFRYDRVGYGERRMTFLADGQIGLGNAGCETHWNLREDDSLAIIGRDGVICVLRLADDGKRKGRWLRHEKMPIELTEIKP